MSKGMKIFLNILYYILTFGIGIFMAASLPTMLVYSYSMRSIKDSLNDGRYGDAMMSVGGYYDNQYNFLNEKGNMVILNTVTLIYNSGEEDDKTIDGTKVHKAYCGFLFNVKAEYKTAGSVKEGNQTKILITDINGEQIQYNFLDYDLDQDGSVDACATLNNYDFIFFEIPIEKTASIKELSFIDNSGDVYYKETLDMPLKFEEAFFNDVDEFVTEYNTDYQSVKLLELNDKLLAKSANYLKSSNSDTISKVNGRTTLYVILYFLAIYMIGDSLIGFRFIPHGCRWLFRKIFKRKQQELKPLSKEINGTMFSNLTIELDVPESFDKPVTVTYSNNNDQIEFYLMKMDNYKKTKHVKCGSYMNLKVIVDKEYEVVEADEVLELMRITEKRTIKIRKRQGEEKWKLQFKT